MKTFILALLSAFLISFSLPAQVSIKDSSIYTPLIGFSYGYYFPGGDLKDRFGNNSALQLNVDFKTKYNWILGINGSYLFGKNIKVSLFDSISTSNGNVINEDGEYADIRLYERGFTVSGTLGRLIPFKKPNPNSGIRIDVGFGFMQHKIRIETIGNDVPQLDKRYKKGYDKLSNGFLLTESIGYLYLSNNRLANIYVGIECMQGFTQSRRSYDYNLMKKDTEKHVDILYGARIAWILPLYKKAPQEYYMY
ncbi:MAG: hypothetical protein K0Q95_2722 [Bacteroidota bacterium]|jgi:hypothetical protein|nr:hypothetical protein [Bacteroidota bacterium]